MQKVGLGHSAIENFRYYYTQLVEGATGLIPETDIDPAAGIPNSEDLVGYEEAGQNALPRAVILKLNGGLGTGMGLDRAKSLLPVRDNLTFLDIIAQQTLALRRQCGCAIPLLLMNSFSTHADSLERLGHYPELDVHLPAAFLQNKIPKVLQDDYRAVDEVSDLAWCPPGHGDLYVALHGAGLLDALLDCGYEYVFVSNSDNLGAVLDPSILGFFAAQQLPFLMEVADRTPADSKGGHLCRRKDGRLALREVAQCPPEDMNHFSDITLHRFFNTNNIWLHLPSLRQKLLEHNGIIRLPLIRNSKTLDPRDPTSPKVFQLETAMGAAIEVFPRAGALRVPRHRFAPVKLCSDLLLLSSDAYLLTNDRRVVPNPQNDYTLPHVQLDSRYYKLIDDLHHRFPAGAPSLRHCESFEVEGDIVFGSDIIVRGRTRVSNPGSAQVRVEDGSVLEGEVVVES